MSADADIGRAYWRLGQIVDEIAFLDHERLELLYQLADLGESARAIAPAAGYSHATVSRILAER